MHKLTLRSASPEILTPMRKVCRLPRVEGVRIGHATQERGDDAQFDWKRINEIVEQIEALPEGGDGEYEGAEDP